MVIVSVGVVLVFVYWYYPVILNRLLDVLVRLVTTPNPSRRPSSMLKVGRKESFSETKLPATKEELQESEPCESSRSGQLSDVNQTNETEMGHPPSREEPAPIPPKRPPKKPHLRARAGISTSPPPTGPRNISPSQEFSFKKIEDSAKELKNLSPLRVSAQSQLSNSSAINFAGRKPRAPDPPQQSPPNTNSISPSSPVESKSPVRETAIQQTSRASTPDLPPPPPPPLDDKEIANTDEPLPPPPSPSQVKGLLENGFSSSSTYHKDSYILHRRDRKLGGGIQQERYSRTMSPASHTTPDNNTSLDNNIMSPTGWDKHYNGRQNASTVVFNSDELKAIKSKQNFKELVASTPVLTSVPSPMETESPNHSSVSLDKVTVTRSTSEATTQVGPVSPRDKNNSLHSSHSSPSLKTYSVARSSSRSPTSQDNSRLQYGLSSTPWHNSTEFLSTRYMYKSVWDQERAISQRNDSLSAAASTSRLNGLGKYDSSASIHRGSSLSSSPLTTSGSVSPLSSTPCSTPTTSLDTVSLAKQDSPSVQNVSTQTQNGEALTTSQEEEEDQQKQCNGTSEEYVTLKYGREKKKEEIECEQLAKTLADQLPDTLQALLAPGPELRTTAHYIQDIFELKVDAGRSKGQITENGEVNDSVVDSNNRCSDSAPLPASSEYFTTSEPKAKLLTTYSKDMSKSQEDLSANGNTATLLRKKEDLLRSISEKIKILREEQVNIREEMNMNEKLGIEILSVVEPLATASNINKLKLHISEIDKITSLLLGLSGRLARAVNALHNLPDHTNPEERRILESKRDKLIEQLDEAKKLKNSIDQRSVSVSQMLQKYVTDDQYADYDHFIKMKAKLIMDSREIDDKIKLGEEQLKALKETLS